MIEADRADYNRAKLDHDLIVAITSPKMSEIPTPRSGGARALSKLTPLALGLRQIKTKKCLTLPAKVTLTSYYISRRKYSSSSKYGALRC